MARGTMALPLLPWLYDAIPGPSGIRFTRFIFFVTHNIPYQELEEVVEVARWRRAPVMSFDFQNRLFAKTYLLKSKRGLFWRNALITPKNAEGFQALLAKNGVTLKSEAASSKERT
jgi:hypothetical protein